jgi:hypothetical protein
MNTGDSSSRAKAADPIGEFGDGGEDQLRYRSSKAAADL